MSRGLERDVPNATKEVWDSRARHYWDANGLLVKGYSETLQLTEPAWDVYLLYAPGVKWEGERPPAPTYWMHQLGSKRRPRQKGDFWDPARFLEAVNRTRGDAP